MISNPVALPVQCKMVEQQNMDLPACVDMQDHLHFGAPPKLRPRTAGASRSSLATHSLDYSATSTSTSGSFTSAPERLATSVNALKESSSLMLRQRLQSPRPGSAAPQQTPRAPGATGSSDRKGVFMKPPMRPKSANAASRQVSRHRMQLVQAPSTSNQQEDLDEELEAFLTAGKEHVVRPGTSAVVGLGKRPFSAAAALSTARSSLLETSHQPGGVQRNFAAKRAASGLKRPHSAAASTRYQPFRALEKSSASLTSCVSLVSRSTKATRSFSAVSGQSRDDRLLASTRENIDDTFVYAVPRHYLERGLPYDPYDIVPVTHETLFGGGSINQLQDAHWDYYTISRGGYTFHLKSDDFQSTFLSLSDWETQKTQFTKLRSLSTFSRFRYRKVFMSWRQWVRGGKREAARESLIADCYFSYPILLSGMQEVRWELSRLQKLLLMWDFDGETYTLERFTAANTQFLKTRTSELRRITTRIQTILTGVCRVFLEDMAPLHAGFPGHEFALSARKSSNFHLLESYVQCEQGLASAHQQFIRHKHFQSMRLPTAEAMEARNSLVLATLSQPGHSHRKEKSTRPSSAQPDELEDIRWTMASIKRRKCKQLTKFMTLVDFLLLDTYARVVKQSLDLFHDFVLRGANAATIKRLTDHEDFVTAMHQILSSSQTAGEGSVGPSSTSQPRHSSLNHSPLTKQQIKAFLHAAWEGKLRAVTSSSVDTEATTSSMSVASMENKLEALFFHGLSNYAGANSETFSVDDLFFVAENALLQLLVLPPFTTINTPIFTTTDTEIDASRVLTEPSMVEQDVLSIPCLGPQPLFALDVATTATIEKRARQRYEICFKPDKLMRVLQRIIIGFTEAFREVPPMLSSPELRSVLDFADDIRALNLHATFDSSRPATVESSRRSALCPAHQLEEARSESEGSDGGERSRCPANRLLERMEEEAHFCSARDDIQDLVRSALNGAADLAASYCKVLELRQQNESVNFDLKARLFRRNEYTLEAMESDANRFIKQLNALETLRMSVNVEFLHFDMHQLQAVLLPSPARCLDAMRELLPRLAREKCDEFLRYINFSSSKIEKPITQNLDSFTTYLLNLREVYDEILDKELDLSFLQDFFGLLDKLKFAAPMDTIKAFELCEPEFQALKSHVQEAYANRDADLLSYMPLLVENLAKLARRVSSLQSAASDQTIAAQSNTCQQARDSAVKLYGEAQEMQEEAARLVRIQLVFEEASGGLRPQSKSFEDLSTLAAELKLKSELWEAVCEADEHLNNCSTDTIRAVDLDKMGEVAGHVDVVVEKIRQCATQVAGGFELERLEKLQATLHGLAPVIRDLRNPHLAERHWTKLEHKMQCSLMPILTENTENVEKEEESAAVDATSSTRLDIHVQQLLEVNAVAHSTAIRHVSEEASAEAAIAGSFMSVVRTWEAQEIPVEARKDRDGRDVYCVGDCVELVSLIEESQVLLRVMDLSTYALVVQERLPKMLNDLSHTKESLELLQVCQRKWDFTQRLVSIDFARTFPEQAKQLQKHDTAWRSLTHALFNRSLCLPFGVNADHRQTLQVILEGFEGAAKTLADHLEIKRQVFPAFFQLSDLELATLLTRCRDVGAIPSFLYQCFDNVGRIVFGVRDGFQDILQVTSRVHGEAETIPMGKNLKARGPVEQWLAAVEKRLAEQLRRSTKQMVEMLARYERSEPAPTLDLTHFSLQSILLADRIVRCGIVGLGLQDFLSSSGPGRFDRIASDLSAHSSRVMNQLLPASGSLKLGPALLSPREMMLRSGLQLQMIQFRDAFASHVASKQTNPASAWTPGGVAVDWEYQLKYRMDDATTVGHECHVEMNTLNIPYGFNYLSPHDDVVVTPSSLRSLFSLFARIRHAQGCTLTGPSESGKRTLSLQVSSILGRRNFSATLTSYTHATRLLIGALYAGGTFCASLQLAGSIRSNAPLIKALATTLASIEHAVLTKNPIVGLHRSTITFVPGTAMLVVVPGRFVADSEEFRIWTEPLSRFAVVQGDQKYIVEALLLSRSFVEPRGVAKQLLLVWEQARCTFSLVSDAASKSHGNPFTFAALKSVISAAASHLDERSLPTAESIKLYQQTLLRDAMLKYFSVRMDSEQLKALQNILDNELATPDDKLGIADGNMAAQTGVPPELLECITLATHELHFVPRRVMLDSISSLATALTFSVSAVLVGPPGVGKTTTYQVLAKAFELCFQRRDQSGNAPSRESDSQAASKPPPTAPSALAKRSNSYLTTKADKIPAAIVAVQVVLPMALTVSQLYGGVSLDGHGRVPSILGQLIRKAQELYVPKTVTAGAAESPSKTQSLLDLANQVWVVFDDALDLRWLEGLLAVLSAPRSITSPLLAFEDGEFMTLPPNLRFVFEVLQLGDATPRFLHVNAVLHLNADAKEDAKTTYRRTKPVDSAAKMDIATAYLHRYLIVQRERVSKQSEVSKSQSRSATDTFNTLEKWLIKSSILAELASILDAVTVHLTPLQRVTNLTYLLQSLISSASTLPGPTRRTDIETFMQFAEELSSGQIRVEMALIYSFMWGFAACTGGFPVVQRQVSDVLRREFEHLTPAWLGCGPDVNLFETLLDLQGQRFVSVVSVSGRTALPPQVSNNSSISALFVPTTSSLVVHAAINEGLRSGRGVLLLSGDNARRTTLARNFLGQLDVIKSIIAAGGVTELIRSHQAVDEDDTKARKPVLSKTMEAATLASVKRLRLRHISLVTWMALRLQKDDDGSLQASRSTSDASISTTSDNKSIASVVEAEEGVPLAITPSTDLSKTALVRQLDRGDVIPFFFSMPRSNASSSNGEAAVELANCLERMLQRERTGIFEPPPGKTALLILDDLHLATPAENSTSQTPLYPSVYAYLRSVQEHGKVYRGASCQPISVENLTMFGSMHVDFFQPAGCTKLDREKSLRKLTSQFFPVLAPSCELEELHHVFGLILHAHWGLGSSANSSTATLPTAVRYALPLVIAATTVIWDRLRATYKYHLQDLARVYEGLAGVSPSMLADVETLLRLWTHECSRTLREPSMGLCSSRQDGDVVGEISRMRTQISQVTQRRASARASRLSVGAGASLSFAVGAKRQSLQATQSSSDDSASPTTLLALFAARSSASPSRTSRPSQQYNSLQEQQHRAAMMGGLWAFVPASVYYDGHVAGEESTAASDPSERVFRRSSASFMLHKSLESSSTGRATRVYAEISFEDDTEAVSTASVQPYFRDLRTFSATTMTLRPTTATSSLPRDVPPVPFKLAQTVVRIDRVLARPAARLLLIDSDGSAADTLLRFATVSRMSELRDPNQADNAIFTLSGLADDPNVGTSVHVCLAMRWKRLLLELYERVGVAGHEATLVVKRLDLLSPAMINQIQTLMTTGEVPGALTLEEQVHLATRVIDERLLALKTKHAAQVAQIRAQVESTRDQALAILHQKQRESPTIPLLDAFQLVETRYQRELRSKLSRVDLRWQQDTDDLRRQREVESESVAATVMALTRPLGVTSGKWASAVARMCSKLRVVLIVDKQHQRRVRAAGANVFAICDVVSVPSLDRESLRTLVYGHFHAQVQQLLETQRKPELVDLLHQMQRSLWSLVCMATDMHLAVVNVCSTEGGEPPPSSRPFAMATFFAKLVVENYKREEAARARASWFLDLSNRLDRDLGALRSSDVLLSEQLTTIDQQLVHHEARLVEQKEDAERIRHIMQRFQTAADEQIQVTNEAQEVAQRGLREPMACLEEANRALLLVDRRHIVEIKSFVSPPPMVHMVLGAVCVLFQLEPFWESARRLLLGDANVVQTLLQFNKDAVSAGTLTKLEAEYLSDERFCHEEVERQSVAAASMVGWVVAIHQYATARHQVQPTLDKLEKAQSRLQLIMNEFQVSKQRVLEADEAWQSTQAAIDAAISRKEALSGEISSLDVRCDSGGQAMEALTEDRKLQHQAASASSMRRGFSLATWNALLSAGALAYACELSFSPHRECAFQAWEAAYASYGGLTPGCPPTSTCCTFTPTIAVVLKATAALDEEPPAGVRDPDTPLTALLSGDYPENGCVETEDALKLVTGAGGLGFSRRRLWDAAFLSLIAATSTLPVVMITRFSPEVEELLVDCARRVWHWQQLHMVYARAPDFDEVFRVAASMGHQLLVLDVEPVDAEPRHDEKHGRFLHAALAWQTTCINGVENLVIAQKSSNADSSEDEYKISTDNSTSIDTIALHAGFRLILTSNADRSAFGEVLDMMPTMDAHLHPRDVADVLLDKIWSNATPKPTNDSNVPASIGPFTLKSALKEHGRLVQKYQVSHAQLTKLLEAAAVASHFPLAQTKALRDRLSSIHEARQVLRDKRREIQEQLRLVKRQCTPLARMGAAVFNAFNATVSGFGPNESPPLMLQVFLPLLMDALTPSSPITMSGTPGTTPAPSTPLLKDTKRPSSSNRLSILARGASSFSLSGSSRRQLNSFGVPADVLTKLVTRIVPLVSPASPRGDWYRFLLQVIITMEEMQSPAQNSTPTAVQEAPQAGSLSVGTILLRSKLRSVSRGNEISSSLTAEVCKAVSVSSTRPDLQRRVVTTIFNGCKLEDAPSGVEDVDEMLRVALPGTSSRSERLAVSLVLFPELVQHICDRVLAGYGVPLNFHRRGSGVTTNTPVEVDATALLEGLWLRATRALPEKTAAVVLARHAFHSFGFARRVFFQGLEGSAALQVRVLKMLVERNFRAEETARSSDVVEPITPLEQLYVLPQSVHPAGHQVEAQQLLLMAKDFKQIAQMEKTQLEALEEVPLAVVNMKGSAGAPEDWEALFQILHRSSRRTSCTALQRHNSMNLGLTIAGEALVKRVSIESSESSVKDSIVSVIPTGGAAPKPPPLVRSGTARRSSTQSMVSRLSAIDTMAPTYPRLVAAVDDIRALPVHLRSNIVCFRDEYEQEAGASSGGLSRASLTKCLQSTVLRLTMYPSVQTLRALVQPAEDDITATRAPLSYFWQVLSGLVLFHATLGFRAHVLRAVYPGALPPPHHPGGVGGVFQYSDDNFLTAVNQYLTTILDKKQHHAQQSRRAGRNCEYNSVLERRIYQQVVLSAYTRLAAGHQEVEFLRRLWSECLQLVSWNESSVESGVKSGALPTFRGRSRPMTSFRDQQRGDSMQASSKSLIKGPSSVSVVKSSLTLGFLAFPSENLREENLSMAQWLELVWNYSTSIDHLMDTKLQTLLLGYQQSINRRGSLEDTSRDLVAASGGIEMVNRPPPSWMSAFGWTNRNHVVLLGDSAELTASIPVRDAINLLQAIIAQALPRHFDMERWSKVTDAVEAERPTSLEVDTLGLNQTMKTLATVYNQHVDTCSLAMERVLAKLLDLEDPDHTDHVVGDALLEGGDEDDNVDDDELQYPRHLNKDGEIFLLGDVEDDGVRAQVVAILRNEVPSSLFGGTSVDAPIPPSWSLHDTLQHYQDWHHFLTESQPQDSSVSPRFWLPGILAAGLPVPHVLDVARLQFCSAESESSHSQSSMQFTLRLLSRTPNSDGQEDEDSESPAAPLPVDTFAILDGLVLLGASWNAESQALDQLSGNSALHQRVELICSLSRGGEIRQPAQVTRVPLLASQNGALLLECPLAVDPTRPTNLATPFLIPMGSNYP
ncbi:hypothetical protein PF011_g7382 [Phytophthora fragariae]|nr:hypothetical protein PF011_g7382 [Phytophthora fragariae]